MVVGFTIDLKTLLGLAMPNQLLFNCHKVNIKLVIIWDKKSLTFMIPIYSTTVLYDDDQINSDYYSTSVAYTQPA